MIRRLLLGILVFVFGMMVLPVVPKAYAYDPFKQACDSQTNTSNSPVCSPSSTEDPVAGPNGVITRAVSLLGWVVGVASVLMVILGGLKYITSNGDSNSLSSAKNTIIYALIGVGVFAMCQAIVIFILNRI